MRRLAAVLNVHTILVALLEEHLCVAVGVSQRGLEVDGALAVDVTNNMGLRRQVIPVGEVSSADRLPSSVKLLRGIVRDGLAGEARELLELGQGISTLDDEETLRLLTLRPAKSALLSLGRNAREDEELLDLRCVVVRRDVETDGLFRDVGRAGEYAVQG